MGIDFASLALTSTIAKTVFGVVSNIKQGQDQNSILRSQAQLAEMKAETDNLAYREKAALTEQEGVRMKAKQIVAAAGAGVTLDSGSFLSIVANSAKRVSEDAETLRRTGRLYAAAGESQGNSLRAQGSAAASAGFWNAGGTLLSGVGKGLQIGKDAGWFN